MMCEINDQMMFVFLTPYFVEHGVSQGKVGQALMALTVGFVSSYPFTQALLKKIPPNVVQFYGSVCFCAARYLMACLVFVPDDYLFPCFVVTTFIVGVVAYTLEVAGSSYVMLSVGPEDRLEANGILQSTRTSANIIAPIVGGSLYSIGGFFVPFFVGATGFLAYLILNRTALLKPFPQEVVDGGKTGSILKDRLCLCATLASTLTFMLMLSWSVWLPPLAVHDFGLPVAVFSIMFCLAIPAFILGLLQVGNLQKKYGFFNALFGCVALQCIAQPLIGPPHYMTWLLPQPSLMCSWIPLLYMVLTNIPFGAFITTWTPMQTNAAINAGFDTVDASVQASSNTVMAAGIAFGLGPLLAGTTVDHYGAAGWCTILICIWAFVMAPLLYYIKMVDATNPKSLAQ
jgi:predicted MFS family arabinose efflux permease